MVDIDEADFQKIVAKAIDTLPARFIENVHNVIFVVEDEPTEAQRIKLHLRGDTLLLGLYEGTPITKRGSGQSFMLPDKITIFKNPIRAISRDLSGLREQVRHTVWHEVAHYFGLNHTQIDKLDQRRRAEKN